MGMEILTHTFQQCANLNSARASVINTQIKARAEMPASIGWPLPGAQNTKIIWPSTPNAPSIKTQSSEAENSPRARPRKKGLIVR